MAKYNMQLDIPNSVATITVNGKTIYLPMTQANVSPRPTVLTMKLSHHRAPCPTYKQQRTYTNRPQKNQHRRSQKTQRTKSHRSQQKGNQRTHTNKPKKGQHIKNQHRKGQNAKTQRNQHRTRQGAQDTKTQRNQHRRRQGAQDSKTQKNQHRRDRKAQNTNTQRNQHKGDQRTHNTRTRGTQHIKTHRTRHTRKHKYIFDSPPPARGLEVNGKSNRKENLGSPHPTKEYELLDINTKTLNPHNEIFWPMTQGPKPNRNKIWNPGDNDPTLV